jgi:hypothetical protein
MRKFSVTSISPDGKHEALEVEAQSHNEAMGKVIPKKETGGLWTFICREVWGNTRLNYWLDESEAQVEAPQ